MEPAKVISSIQAGFGDALSFIAIIVSGIFYGGWISRFISPAIPDLAGNKDLTAETASEPPSLPLTISILLLPLALIFAGTLTDFAHLSGTKFLKFLGHPFSALLI